MKNNIALSSVILIVSVFGFGCGTLSKSSKDVNISQSIPAHSRMLIRVEDASAFKLDIENLSNDTLVLERKGIDNLVITKASVKVIIEPAASTALSNASDRAAEVKLRVYDYKSKVIHNIEEIKPEVKPIE